MKTKELKALRIKHDCIEENKIERKVLCLMK